MTVVLPPDVGDPVVIEGLKYRIRSIDPKANRAELRTSFRPRPGADFERASVDPAALTWDRVAAVWRLAS